MKTIDIIEKWRVEHNKTQEEMSLLLGLKTQQNYNDLFAALRKKLEIDKNHTIYAMKHTRAIHMVEDGATLDEIMRFLRHTSTRVTQQYLRELGAEVNLGVAEKGIKF